MQAYIKNTNSRYIIYDSGIVYDLKTEKEVSQVLTGKPQYYYVNLYVDGKRKLKRVHRILAEAFIPNPDKLPIVDHINRNKLDNGLHNLRWVSKASNNRNKDKHIRLTGGMLLTDWCTKYEDKYAYNKIYNHSKRYDTSIDKAIKIYEDPLTAQEYIKRSGALYIIHENISYPFPEFCRKHSLPYEQSRARFKYHAWTSEELIQGFTEDSRKNWIVYKGNYYPTKKALCEAIGIHRETLRTKLNKGMTITGAVDSYLANK